MRQYFIMKRKVSENVILISVYINYLILKISNVILIYIKKVKLYILFQTMRENLLKRRAMQSFKNRTFNKQLLRINIW
jgi:hypothetical protein